MTIAEKMPQPDPSTIEHAGDAISDSLLRTLPGNAYFSPEIFAAEQERIFERMWFCAARASELPKPGDFRTVQVGRESIIVSRNRKGQPRAFFNICRHRGARICGEESGTGNRKFQCPYHAWTYDLDRPRWSCGRSTCCRRSGSLGSPPASSPSRARSCSTRPAG